MVELLLAQALNASIVAGGLSSLGSQDSYSITPTAEIIVKADTVKSKDKKSDYSPDLIVKVNLSSLPEESLSLSNVETFRSLRFEAGLGQRIPGILPKLFVGYGFETRLPGEDKPRVRVGQYFTGGIYFATEEGESYLFIGGGADERLNNRGLYEATVHIEGKLKLYSYKGKTMGSDDPKISLKGDTIITGKSSLVRIGIVVGI